MWKNKQFGGYLDCPSCEGRGFAFVYNNTLTDRLKVKCIACDGRGKVEGEAFPASVLDATRWLMKYAPERLPAWLDRHELGLKEAAERK